VIAAYVANRAIFGSRLEAITSKSLDEGKMIEYETSNLKHEVSLKTKQHSSKERWMLSEKVLQSLRDGSAWRACSWTTSGEVC
jgi:hypothetical protein